MSKPDLSMDCAYYFINQMLETNADEFNMTIEGVTKHEKKIGDFKLTVKKISGEIKS